MESELSEFVCTSHNGSGSFPSLPQPDINDPFRMLRFHNNSIGSAFRNLKGKIRSCRSISGINRCAILSGNHHARGAAACFKVNLQGVPFFQLQRMYIAPGHLMKIQKVAFRVFDAYTGKAGLIEAACEDCGSRNQKQQTANQNPFVTFHFDLRYGALF